MLDQNHYKCAACGEVFEKGVSDEEALQEKEELWGEIPLEQMVLVCDDCWKKMFPDEDSDELI